MAVSNLAERTVVKSGREQNSYHIKYSYQTAPFAALRFTLFCFYLLRPTSSLFLSFVSDKTSAVDDG